MILPFDPKQVVCNPEDYLKAIKGPYGERTVVKVEGFLDSVPIDFSHYTIEENINEETHHFAVIHPYIYNPNLRHILAFPKATFPRLEYGRFRILKWRKLAILRRNRRDGKFVFEVIEGEPILPTDVVPEKPDIKTHNSISDFVEEILFQDLFNAEEKDRLMPFMLSAIGAPILYGESRTGGIGVNPIVVPDDDNHIKGAKMQGDEMFGRIAKLTSTSNFLIGYDHALPKRINLGCGLYFDLNPTIPENSFDLKFGTSLTELETRYPGFEGFLQNRPIGFYPELETSFIAASNSISPQHSVDTLLRKTDVAVVLREDILKVPKEMPKSLKFYEALRYFRYIHPSFANSLDEQRSKQKIIDRLTKIKDGLENNYKFSSPIDINYNGKIATIIQLARAYARMSEQNSIKEEHIHYALNAVDSNSGEAVNWRTTRFKAKASGKQDFTKDEILFLRVVDKHQDGCSKKDAMEEFVARGGMNSRFEVICDKLLANGNVFEPRRGFIKTL